MRLFYSDVLCLFCMVLVDFNGSFKAHSSIWWQLHLSDLLWQMLGLLHFKIKIFFTQVLMQQSPWSIKERRRIVGWGNVINLRKKKNEYSVTNNFKWQNTDLCWETEIKMFWCFLSLISFFVITSGVMALLGKSKTGVQDQPHTHPHTLRQRPPSCEKKPKYT